MGRDVASTIGARAWHLGGGRAAEGRQSLAAPTALWSAAASLGFMCEQGAGCLALDSFMSELTCPAGPLCSELVVFVLTMACKPSAGCFRLLKARNVRVRSIF